MGRDENTGKRGEPFLVPLSTSGINFLSIPSSLFLCVEEKDDAAVSCAGREFWDSAAFSVAGCDVFLPAPRLQQLQWPELLMTQAFESSLLLCGCDCYCAHVT